MFNPWKPRREPAAGRPAKAEIACAEAQARLLASWWNDAESNADNLAAIACWLEQAPGTGDTAETAP